MPKATKEKKAPQLRHAPLSAVIEKPTGILKAPKNRQTNEDVNEDFDDDDQEMTSTQKTKIFKQAKAQRNEKQSDHRHASAVVEEGDSDEDYDDEVLESDDENGENMVEFEGDYVQGTGLSEAEEAVVQKFLSAGRSETRTLADIIMEKIKEKESADATISAAQNQIVDKTIPKKVVDVYTAVGKMLHHYKSGKLPKALKMLPHLRNWEDVLWLTRPDEWSSAATFACTRIFASNLNAKMAQRFFNLVLLEKCRDDIKDNNKLNYHLYMALKKALFKPAAFYKGLLLPLAQEQTCTLREATIIGSVLAKVSIQANHSAAALLRLAEMPYCGSTSLFIKVLLNKKYALPRRVIEALVVHFSESLEETRMLPVIWHQALLVFVQRYKLEFDESQRERLRQLCKIQSHHQISSEIRRELSCSATTAN